MIKLSKRFQSPLPYHHFRVRVPFIRFLNKNWSARPKFSSIFESVKEVTNLSVSFDAKKFAF
jgi:hypothetical protein